MGCDHAAVSRLSKRQKKNRTFVQHLSAQGSGLTIRYCHESETPNGAGNLIEGAFGRTLLPAGLGLCLEETGYFFFAVFFFAAFFAVFFAFFAFFAMMSSEGG